MNEKDLYSELSTIRGLMERSAKFISISGISGILAGIYALIGAYVGFRTSYGLSEQFSFGKEFLYGNVLDQGNTLFRLSLIAFTVLFLSIGTGILFSLKKAKKQKQKIWNHVSRSMLTAIAIPLLTGGLFVLILLGGGLYDLILPAFLIFYGLALVSGSQYTFKEIKWLGIFEIVLGIVAMQFPGYGYLLWILGFGILHIVYGSIMHFKYDR